MKRLLGWLVRLLVLLALLPVGYSFLREGLRFILAIPNGTALKWAGLGAAAGIVLALIFSEQTLRLLEAMNHEGKHALVAWGSGHQVTGIEAYANQNSVTHVQSPTWPIYLAPYTLPLLTLPFLLVRAILPGLQPAIMELAIGFTFAFHLIELIHSVGYRQTDLRIVGFVLSLVIIFLVNAIFLIVVLAVVSGDLVRLFEYFRESIAGSPAYYLVEFRLLRGLATGLLALVR